MKWSDRFYLLLLSCIMAGFLAGDVAAGTEITVSAALSLKAPFEEIGRVYEKKTGIRVIFNFAASGLLQKQIEAGAPADVFASASPKEMIALERSGLLIAESRADFAGNEVVLIAGKNRSMQITSFSDMKKSSVIRVAIGNPATVPAGKYAQETLLTLGLWNDLQAKLVYAENVRQVMDYVARDEVDAGMVFLTDSVVRGRDLRVIAEAPASSHSPVTYPIAIIRGSTNKAAAQAFISLVVSKEGGDILLKHGFAITR